MTRLSRRRLLVTALAAVAAESPDVASAKALWPGARYTRAHRDRAIRRGLRFIYRLARVRKNFDDYGDDMLWCFYSLSIATADPWIKRTAWDMGQERARQWRRDNPRVPPDADADDVWGLVSGSFSADSLGVRDDAMKKALAKAARRFSAIDFLRFDPATGVIPDNVRDPCGDDAPKNSTSDDCDEPDKIMSPYELLTDALVTTYTGDHYGVRLGASLAEVAALVPRMRPYRVDEDANAGFIDVSYAVTHIVYALNDYGKYRLRPEWLPDEYAFLKDNLRQSIKDDDPETTGEFLDTLRAFGMTDRDALIQEGMAFVLARQHADGSWGERDGKDAYTPYHSTWTAINGLMDYAWEGGEGTPFPEALARARGFPINRI
jgi:hypothetical protein